MPYQMQPQGAMFVVPLGQIFTARSWHAPDRSASRGNAATNVPKQ